MSNKEKYINAFVEGLEISAEEVTETLEYQGIPNWDSVGHMALVACLEDAFDITVDESELTGIFTVGDIMKYIKSKKE